MIDGWLVPVFKLSNWFFVSAFCQNTGFWIVFQSVRSQQRGNCIIDALVYKTVTAVGLCCFKHLRSFHGNVHVFTNLATISIIEAINLPIHATNIKIIWCFCQNKLKISTQTIHNNRYYVVGIIMSVNFTTLIFLCFNIKLNSLSTHIEETNHFCQNVMQWREFDCVWSRKPSQIWVRRYLWRIQLKNSYYRRFSNLTYLFSFVIYNLNNEPHWRISFCKLHFDIIFTFL